MGPQAKDRARTSPAITCIKILLHVFNFLYMVIGVCILAVGILTQVELKNYLELAEMYYVNTPWILIAVGVLILFVAVGGFYCTAKDKIAPLYMYAIFISLLAIIQVGAGIAGGVFAGQLDDKFITGLSDTIGKDASQEYWDNVQKTLKCCGVNGSSDWLTYGDIPASCYEDDKRPSPTEGPTTTTVKSTTTTSTVSTSTPSNTTIPANSTSPSTDSPTTTGDDFNDALSDAGSDNSTSIPETKSRRKREADEPYTQGCHTLIQENIKKYLAAIIGVCIGFVILQVVGATLACCLAKKTSKNNYEQIY